MNKKDQEIFKFLKHINQLKTINRLSIININDRRESVAEHTWHLIMFIWLYNYVYKKKINLTKAIKIALVHDLAEIQIGDNYGLSRTEKNTYYQEKKAIQKLCKKLPNNITKEILSLWKEYQERKTNDSKYVWAFDKICPRFQLNITKSDLSHKHNTDKNKKLTEEKEISEISPTFKEILKKIKKN